MIFPIVIEDLIKMQMNSFLLDGADHFMIESIFRVSVNSENVDCSDITKRRLVENWRRLT